MSPAAWAANAGRRYVPEDGSAPFGRRGSNEWKVSFLSKICSRRVPSRQHLSGRQRLGSRRQRDGGQLERCQGAFKAFIDDAVRKTNQQISAGAGAANTRTEGIRRESCRRCCQSNESSECRRHLRKADGKQ